MGKVRRRRWYTADSIRQNFRVLYVGHSFLHLISAVLPDDDDAIMAFLQSHASVDLFKQPLCNDTAWLHKDDLMEDLFTMQPGHLAQLLPLGHFDAVVLRNCPAVLSSLALGNFAAILHHGGILVAFPAHLEEHAEVPWCLSSRSLESSAGEDTKGAEIGWPLEI